MQFFDRLSIFREIHDERERQDAKWGEQDWPVRDENDRSFYAEQAYKWRKICDAKTELGRLTWFHIAIEEFFEAFDESDPKKQREELKQCAAVLVSAIECIDRKERQVAYESHR